MLKNKTIFKVIFTLMVVLAMILVTCTVATFKITISPEPENGSITLDPATGPYDSDTTVTVTAVPDTGYIFDSWGGDLAEETGDSATLTMTKDYTITANFVVDSSVSFFLTVTNDGNGSVTIDPDISEYGPGEEVTLTPQPNSNYGFNEWTGDDFSDVVDNSDGTYTITMNENKSITANFITYTLTINENTNGDVIISPDKASYAPFEEVVLTPKPNQSYEFGGWTGDTPVSNGDGSYTITMDNDKSITPSFVEYAWEEIGGPTKVDNDGYPDESFLSLTFDNANIPYVSL